MGEVNKELRRQVARHAAEDQYLLLSNRHPLNLSSCHHLDTNSDDIAVSDFEYAWPSFVDQSHNPDHSRWDSGTSMPEWPLNFGHGTSIIGSTVTNQPWSHQYAMPDGDIQAASYNTAPSSGDIDFILARNYADTTQEILPNQNVCNRFNSLSTALDVSATGISTSSHSWKDDHEAFSTADAYFQSDGFYGQIADFEDNPDDLLAPSSSALITHLASSGLVEVAHDESGGTSGYESTEIAGRDFGMDNAIMCPGTATEDDEILIVLTGSRQAGNRHAEGRRLLSSSEGCGFPRIRQMDTVSNLISANGGFKHDVLKGTLDKYIYELRKVLKVSATHTSLGPELRLKVASEGVLWVVREAWPQVEQFWKTTASFQGFLQCEMWLNFPGRATYELMDAAYRPTLAQLSIPHSPMIDWLPWPELRDKLIEHQDEINMDQISSLAIQNVVAHRSASLSRKRDVEGDHPTEVGNTKPSNRAMSFRIWDLCLLEENNISRLPQNTDLVYTPRSASVEALVKAYSLECNNFQTQRLHARFFDVFPSLFVPSAISDYDVRELSALHAYSQRDALCAPREISQAAVERLRTSISRMIPGSV